MNNYNFLLEMGQNQESSLKKLIKSKRIYFYQTRDVSASERQFVNLDVEIKFVIYMRLALDLYQ